MQLVEILSKNRRPYFGDAGFIWLGGDRQLVLLRPLWGIRSSIEGRSELKTDTCCCKEPQESVDWWPWVAATQESSSSAATVGLPPSTLRVSGSALLTV